MNHISSERLPYVTSLSRRSTVASNPLAIWGAIASARRFSAVVCHVSATGHWGQLLAANPYWLQEAISEATDAKAAQCAVGLGER